MTDMNKRGPECDDDCDGERGKRGKRGHRGHDGHDGATGPTGPTGFASGGSGLLKFSGDAPIASQVPGPVISFLADTGLGSTASSISPAYPVAIDRNLRNLAVNIFGFIVPLNGSILVELLQNGAPVPGFSVTYAPGDSGIKAVAAGPTPYAIGATFALRISAVIPVSFVQTVSMSATVGVE